MKQKLLPSIVALLFLTVLLSCRVNNTDNNSNSPEPSPIISVISLPSPTPKQEQPSAEKSVIVYVTNTGKKYHTDGCRYLNKSKFPTNLNAAKHSYEACLICNPPQ